MSVIRDTIIRCFAYAIVNQASFSGDRVEVSSLASLSALVSLLIPLSSSCIGEFVRLWLAEPVCCENDEFVVDGHFCHW